MLLLVIKYATPFVIALVLAALIEPLNRFLSKKRKITLSRSLAALIGTILIVTVVTMVLFSVGNLLVTQARELILILPKRYPDLAQDIRDYIASLQRSMDLLPAEALQAIDSILSRLGSLSPVSSVTRPVTFLLCGLHSRNPAVLLF